MKAHQAALACFWVILALPLTLAAAPPSTPAAAAHAGASAPRVSEAMPEDLRPENPVITQINVPLGRTPPAPAARARRPARAGSVDDAAARCQAMELPVARAECLRRLMHQAAPR